MVAKVERRGFGEPVEAERLRLDDIRFARGSFGASGGPNGASRFEALDRRVRFAGAYLLYDAR